MAGETLDFLNKFHKELTNKRLKDELTKLSESYLEVKSAKYALYPIAMGLFGGIIDYNKMNIITRRTFSSQKKRYEETALRRIRRRIRHAGLRRNSKWVREIALKARQ